MKVDSQVTRAADGAGAEGYHHSCQNPDTRHCRWLMMTKSTIFSLFSFHDTQKKIPQSERL